MNKNQNKVQIITQFQKLMIFVIVISFIFVTLHSAMHISHEHKHDSSCSVYVLEQLYFAGDTVQLISVITLFIPFVFALFGPLLVGVRVQKQFTIRAPPLS